MSASPTVPRQAIRGVDVAAGSFCSVRGRAISCLRQALSAAPPAVMDNRYAALMNGQTGEGAGVRHATGEIRATAVVDNGGRPKAQTHWANRTNRRSALGRTDE